MSLAGFDDSKKIVVALDHADVSSDLTDFPVALPIGTSVGKTGFDNSIIITELGSNYNKIAVEVGDTGVQCYVEVEYWDTANSKGLLHVKVPNVSSSVNTVLNLYYSSSNPDNSNFAGETNETTDTTLQMVVNISSEGTYDTAHAYSPSVIRLSGGSFVMWYSGHDGTNYRIIRATSVDGITWTNFQMVVNIGSEGTYDTNRTYNPSVIQLSGGSFVMWYSGHNGTNVRTIRATSVDGITWTNFQMVVNISSEGTYDTAHAYAPDVIQLPGGSFVMWYSGHNGTNVRIIRATSVDGITWTNFQVVVNIGSEGTYDTAHAYSPSVIRLSDGSFVMWYAGSDGTNYRIIRATSVDGITWTNFQMVVNISSEGTYDTAHAYESSALLLSDGSFTMWYSGHNGTNVRIIRAISYDGIDWHSNFVPAQSVWDGSFKAVYHMAQDPSGTAPQILDSTSNVNHGTSQGSMTSSDLIDGPTGKAIAFDGSDDTISLPSGTIPAASTAFSLEMLLSCSNNTTEVRPFSYNDDGMFQKVVYNGSTGGQISFASSDGTSNYTVTATHNGTVKSEIAYTVAENGTLYAYINGASVGSVSSGAFGVVSGTGRYIGASRTPGLFLPGEVDEVRISNTVRSAAWISATNKSLRDELIIFSLLGNRVVAFLEQSYDLEILIVTKSLEQIYHLPFPVVQTLVQVYGLRMVATLQQHYSDAPVVKQILEQWYGDAAQLRTLLEQPYEDAYQLISSLQQPYCLPEFLQKVLDQRYSIAGVELSQVLEQPYSIRGVEVANSLLVQPYTLIDGSGQVLQPALGDGVVVQADSGPGVSLKYYYINIEASRDQYCISCEVYLAGQAAYAQVNILDTLILTVGGEDFVFFVESKSRDRSHGRAKYVIKGLSKTALLDAPWAEPITEELFGMASQIVANLAPGYTIDFNTVDQYYPEGVLLPGDKTPLAIIRDIAAAMKAVVQTEPDGTLTIEPYRPVSVNHWSTCPTDHTLSDALDFFTTGEDYDHRPGYNRYLISDQLTSEDSLRLEEEPLTSSTKNIRCYQTPWADDFNLRHTGGDWVTLEPLGIEERVIEDEVVEFVNGQGRTSYPIYERIAVDWLENELGTVTFGEDGSLVSNVAGESLLKISYRTKCRLYLITDHQREQVQLVAEGED